LSALLIGAIVLVAIGLAGTVLPALPGSTFVFAGLALAAYDQQFTRVGYVTLGLLAALTLLTFAVDFFATVLGAKKVGASKLAMIGAALGTLGGLMMGIVGVLIGPFVGAVVGELLHQRKNPKDSIAHASKVGLGAWVGLLVGTVAKLIIVGLMIGIFLIVYFK
jgi:uncharacterized protein